MKRLLLALALLLAAPASAQAAFGVSSFTVTPSTLQAGSHPDVSVAVGFSGDEHLRDLTVSLPAGLVGNPNATPRCAAAKFQADQCAANTRVGTTSVVSTVLGLPLTADGDVYNLEPAGEPARLGVIVRPPAASKVFLITRVTLRPADGGLDSVISGIPSTVTVLGIPQEMTITSMNLTLLGRPGNSSTPFMTMPTGCGPATAHVTATPASGAAVTRDAPPFTPTACAKLPFKPSLEATLSTGALPSLRTVITGPPGNANTARATVLLPAALGINVNALANICSAGQQAGGSCPEPSRVGRAAAVTPLLPPLSGPVYLAELAGQVLPGLRVFLSGPVSLSLAGTVDALHTPLKTEFAGIPDVPLERFDLSFDAGRAVQARSDVCRGPVPRIAAELTGHNGAVANLRVPVTVTGCRKPAATVRVRGRKLALRVDAVRGGPALRFVRLTLPRKLKAHPHSGRVSKGRLSRRGVLTIRTRAVRHVTATLRRGAFTRRAAKGALKFKLTTLDNSGRRVRQTVKARR